MIARALAGPARLIELARFGFVGATSTLLYALLSLALLALGAPPAPASALAYLASGALSYWGHKRFTFDSAGAHNREAPRFVLANACGFAIALGAPVAAQALHVPAAWAVLFTCVAVPATSYFLMRHLVFAAPSAAVAARRA